MVERNVTDQNSAQLTLKQHFSFLAEKAAKLPAIKMLNKKGKF